MPSGDVLVLVDESGRVVEWGRPAEELFGWSAEEAVGQPVSTLMREAATDGEGRRGKFTDAAAVLVKPVLRGTSVVWQVLSAGDTMSGQDVAILKAVFTHSPVGLHVLDDQLRVVRMSTTTGGPRDAEVERLVGKQFTEAYELANPEEESAVAQRVLDSGVPVVNRLVRRITSPGLPRAVFTPSPTSAWRTPTAMRSDWWRPPSTSPSGRRHRTDWPSWTRFAPGWATG